MHTHRVVTKSNIPSKKFRDHDSKLVSSTTNFETCAFPKSKVYYHIFGNFFLCSVRMKGIPTMSQLLLGSENSVVGQSDMVMRQHGDLGPGMEKRKVSKSPPFTQAHFVPNL